jgi:hypothetical protein
MRGENFILCGVAKLRVGAKLEIIRTVFGCGGEFGSEYESEDPI